MACAEAPTATSASITTLEDTASAGVTPSVSDPDPGDTHTFTILTNPAHGSATVVANQLVYTPVTNYNGPDSFTYRATDQG
ncbi:Ig-like domain-containing protein, partial [Geobacter sp.]|uniref:Ig-like domain-containing protein n=1 Tax=Geobacter sp. TaxID=46610 RepID=UPI002602B131